MMESVNRKTYADAVITLLDVAQKHSEKSGVCAQVLLSAYNGFDFQLSIPDLRCLDSHLYQAAITVIRGRVEVGNEPYELIKGGSDIFIKLHNRYKGLHLENRGKVYCPSCRGGGRTYRNDYDEKGETCSHCYGEGRVCRCKA